MFRGPLLAPVFMTQDTVGEGESRQPINVDLVRSEDLSALDEWASALMEPFRREMTAKWIAQLIVVLSAVCLLIILILGFILIFLLKREPATAKQLIQESVIPLLEKSATFFTTVFGPLLAFILGYYFGQRQAQRRAGDSS
jgi:hypothetical protein